MITESHKIAEVSERKLFDIKLQRLMTLELRTPLI